MPRERHAFRAREQIDEEQERGSELRVADGGQTLPGPVLDVDVAALGYISATEPLVSGELDRQAAAITGFCARRAWELIGLVREIHEPRRRDHMRPSLTHAIERLRGGDASCLVVAEVRRLCPSVAELGGILNTVEEAGARLVSLDPPMDSGTRSGRAAMYALKSVSSWERARRAAMIGAARAKVAAQNTIPPRLKRRIQRMRGAGMTLQAIADALNEDGIPTVRGGAKWRPSSVQGALGYRRPPS